MDTLDEDELETILIIAHNGQSGRITEYEIKLLVEAYRLHVLGQRSDEPEGGDVLPYREAETDPNADVALGRNSRPDVTGAV